MFNPNIFNPSNADPHTNWQEKFPFVLRGTGPTIQQFYEDRAGPEAYLGTVVPEFPNFYMLSGKWCLFLELPHNHLYAHGCIVGPNTAVGYTSVLIFNEVQVSI